MSGLQLAKIGSIALLYNGLEQRVNEMCAEGLHVPINDDEVLKRISGVQHVDP